MGKSFIECKTVLENGKRRLRYVNTRTKKNLPIVVGSKGGLSVKPPGAKSRRYVKKQCLKANAGKQFWEIAKSAKNKSMKKK